MVYTSDDNQRGELVEFCVSRDT